MVCAVVSGQGVFVPLFARVVSLSQWSFAVKSFKVKADMICGFVQRAFGNDFGGVWGRIGDTKLEHFIVYEYLLVHLIHLVKRKKETE